MEYNYHEHRIVNSATIFGGLILLTQITVFFILHNINKNQKQINDTLIEYIVVGRGNPIDPTETPKYWEK